MPTWCIPLFSVQAAQQDQSRCDNKVRFIMAVVNGELEVRNRKRSEIEKDLDRMGFDRLGKASAKVRCHVPRTGVAVTTCQQVRIVLTSNRNATSKFDVYALFPWVGPRGGRARRGRRRGGQRAGGHHLVGRLRHARRLVRLPAVHVYL